MGCGREIQNDKTDTLDKVIANQEPEPDAALPFKCRADSIELQWHVAKNEKTKNLPDQELEVLMRSH